MDGLPESSTTGFARNLQHRQKSERRKIRKLKKKIEREKERQRTSNRILELTNMIKSMVEREGQMLDMVRGVTEAVKQLQHVILPGEKTPLGSDEDQQLVTIQEIVPPPLPAQPLLYYSRRKRSHPEGHTTDST